MSQPYPTRANRTGDCFILYIEGPRDRGILHSWGKRMLPGRDGRLLHASVILGGRQPSRALAHFRSIGGAGAGARALCVLDRDDGGPDAGVPDGSEPGLEFFTWSRRHIESYLLVPDAIRRALGLSPDDRRVDVVLEAHRDRTEPDGYRDVDAKRLLGPRGELPRALGCSLPLGRIARFTREEELHRDVHALFARIRGEVVVPG